MERVCVECGRPTFFYDRDPKSSGLRIRTGDRVHVSPEGLMRQLKLKGGMRFSRAALDVFVRGLFVPAPNIAEQPQKTLPPLLEAWAAEAEAILRESPRLAGVDLDTESGAEDAFRILEAQKEVAEFSALILDYACSMTRKAIESSDAWGAAGVGKPQGQAQLIHATVLQRASRPTSQGAPRQIKSRAAVSELCNAARFTYWKSYPDTTFFDTQ